MTRSGPHFPSPDPLQRRMAEARQARDEYRAAIHGRDARPGPSPRWAIALAVAALGFVLNAGFLIGGLADPGPPDAADWAFRDLPAPGRTAAAPPCPADRPIEADARAAYPTEPAATAEPTCPTLAMHKE